MGDMMTIDASKLHAMAAGTWVPPVKRWDDSNIKDYERSAAYDGLAAHHEAESKALMATIQEMAKQILADATAVKETRDAQRAYFKTRTPDALRLAIAKEAAIDKRLAEIIDG